MIKRFTPVLKSARNKEKKAKNSCPPEKKVLENCLLASHFISGGQGIESTRQTYFS